MPWSRSVWLWLALAVAVMSCTAVANGNLAGKPSESDLSGTAAGGAGAANAEGGGVDTPKQSIGTPCGQNAECASGSCTDGVCCDQACVGECVSCDKFGLYGTCTLLTGEAGDCPNNELCGADGACTAVAGEGCINDSDCAATTGYCTDGVCCNERCLGDCESCVITETGVASGICAGPMAGQAAPECGGDTCSGMGLCCTDALPPTGSNCPSECSECEDGVCIITCEQEDGCKGENIVCPADFDCVVECVAKHACRDAAIDCPPGHRCDVKCDAEHACEDARLTCTNGPCSLACLKDNGGDPCKGNTEVRCGTNACNVTCDGNKPTGLDCGPSCSCQPC